MSELVTKLCEGTHPVEISLRPERSLQLLKECLDRDFVHVKFTATRGGTELGIPIDRSRASFADADLERGTGRMTIVGDLTLDFQKVRCRADIELPSMTGTGHLERLPD